LIYCAYPYASTSKFALKTGATKDTAEAMAPPEDMVEDMEFEENFL